MSNILEYNRDAKWSSLYFVVFFSDSTGKNVFEDIKIVSENFKIDFIQKANGVPRDLLLVLDSSGSITEDDFNAMKEGVKVLIDVLCGGFGSAATNNRLSIILFSTDSVLSYRFDMDQSPELLKQAVDGLQHMSQFTCTGSALELAYEAFDPKYGKCFDVLVLALLSSFASSSTVSVKCELLCMWNVNRCWMCL